MQISRLIKSSISERSLIKRSSSKRKECSAISEGFDGKIRLISAFMKSQVLPYKCMEEFNDPMSAMVPARLNQACASAISTLPIAIFFKKNFYWECTVSSIRSGRKYRIW